MKTYEEFSNLLSDEITAGTLPNITFTNNANLRSNINHLVILSNKIASGDDINSSVASYEALKYDQLNNESEFYTLNEMANAFAKKLNVAIGKLHMIKDYVNQLVEATEDYSIERIAEDVTLSKIYNIEKDLSMEAIRWDLLDNCDEASVRFHIHNTINLPLERTTDKSVLGIVLNQLPYANKYNEVALTPISLSNDKFSKIVNTLHTELPDLSIDQVAGMLRNILTLKADDCRSAILKIQDFINGKSADSINNIITVCSIYNRLAPFLNNGTLDLAESTWKEFEKHVQVLNQIIDTYVYVCDYYRNNVWDKAIMVPGGLYNTDNIDEFKENGGTITNLVQHKKRFYSDMQIPINGVSGAFVMQTAKTVSDSLSSQALKNVKEINTRKKEIDRGAFIVTLTNFLNSNSKNLSVNFAHRNNISKFAESIYDSAANEALESKYYKALLNSMNVDSLSQIIYDRLGKAYANYAKDVGSLSKEVCEDLDTKVYSDLIAEYLVNQNIIICD